MSYMNPLTIFFTYLDKQDSGYIYAVLCLVNVTQGVAATFPKSNPTVIITDRNYGQIYQNKM